MKTFLPDATDFTDMRVKDHPGVTYPNMKDHTVCPVCHGYGGWNLELDAYKNGTTPEQRHFRASCFQCHGWGWVSEEDKTCVHEYVEIKPDQPWRCWHTYQCTKCGRKKSVDSSD